MAYPKSYYSADMDQAVSDMRWSELMTKRAKFGCIECKSFKLMQIGDKQYRYCGLNKIAQHETENGIGYCKQWRERE